MVSRIKPRKKRSKSKKTEKKNAYLKIIDLLLSPKSQYKELCQSYNQSKNNTNYARKDLLFLKLIREAIVSHRYDAVSAILLHYPDFKVKSHEHLYKAGLQVLEMTGNMKLREDFIRPYLTYAQINEKEVVLDHIIYLFNNEDIMEMEEIVMKLSSVKKLLSKQKKNRKYIKLLVTGYEGILQYTLWYKMLKGNDNVMSSQKLSYTSNVERVANLAIHSFSTLLHEPGNWDIFIVKYLHILIQNNDSEEAENILKQYLGNNPENLNAHIYYIKFLQRYEYPYKKQVKALKEFIKIAPYHDLVINLVKKIRWNKEEHVYCLKKLFNFLDYSDNKSNENAWMFLYEIVRDIFGLGIVDDSFIMLRKCWVKRSFWWNPYHFPVHDYKVSEYNLLYYKAGFLAYLVPKDSKYLVNARKVLKKKSHPKEGPFNRLEIVIRQSQSLRLKYFEDC